LAKQLKIGMILLAATLVSLLYFIYPATSYQFYPGCALYSLTGFYCPACGSQRAFSLLLHGKILQALQYNLLFVLAVVMGLFLFTRYISGKKHPLLFRMKPAYWWLVLSLVLVYWVLRNLPFYPFSLLRPA
jgi:hypothetical protein